MKRPNSFWYKKNTLVWLKEKSAIIFTPLLWIALFADVYLGAEKVLPRDNLHHHLPIFLYWVRYLKTVGDIPTWFLTYDGGLWMEVLANNFMLLLPSHLFGILLASFTSLNANFCYKLSLVVGQGVFLWGCAWAIRPVVNSRWLRLVVLLLGAFSSLLLTVQHQEQGLATVFYIPWIWGSFVRTAQRPRYFLLAIILFGLSLNAHYPQFQVVYWVLAAIFLLPEAKQLASRIIQCHPIFWLLAVAAFFMTVAPLLHSMTYRDRLESPYRWQRGSIQSESYADYLEKNYGARWNVHPENLGLYGNFFSGKRNNLEAQDDGVFHVPFAVLVLTLLLILKVRYKVYWLCSIIVFSLFSLGTYGPLPKFLWSVFPAISMFRQWYHFTLLMDLQFCFALVFVLEALAKEFFNRDSKRIEIGAGLLAGATFLSALSPLYTLVPAVALIVGRRLQKLNPLRWMPLGPILIWAMLMGVVGAVSILKNYERALLPYSSIYYGAISNQDALSQMVGTYREQVVRPKGIENVFVRELAMRELFYWRDANGKLTPFSVQDYDYFWNREGLHLSLLKVPENARGILFAQAADGDWEMVADGHKLDVTPGYLGLASVNTIGKTLLIRRKQGAWEWLIVLMWLPLIALLAAEARNRITRWLYGHDERETCRPLCV